MNRTIKIAFGSIVIGIVVLGLKTVAWQITGSVALLSDALESTVNVATAVAALKRMRRGSAIRRDIGPRRHRLEDR